MSNVVIVYHSGFGHTQALAEAVASGARAVSGTVVSLIPVAEAEARAAELDAADAIIFGSPTYMGGVSAELFNDTALRMLLPGWALSRDEARVMAKELKSWPLLDGYRGRAKADVDALLSAVVAFSAMAVALGDRLIEAEINPLFVLPVGQGVLAADGVAVISDGEPQAEGGRG